MFNQSINQVAFVQPNITPGVASQDGTKRQDSERQNKCKRSPCKRNVQVNIKHEAAM